jgi:hypothetical protein
MQEGSTLERRRHSGERDMNESGPAYVGGQEPAACAPSTSTRVCRKLEKESNFAKVKKCKFKMFERERR